MKKLLYTEKNDFFYTQKLDKMSSSAPVYFYEKHIDGRGRTNSLESTFHELHDTRPSEKVREICEKFLKEKSDTK